jgi:hypothetical protein
VYDTLFGADNFDVNVALVSASALAAGSIAADAIAATCVAAAAIDKIWDEDMVTNHSAREVLGILLPAFAAGKVSGGGGTTITFRDLADGFNALAMTVDENGNRSTCTIAYS